MDVRQAHSIIRHATPLVTTPQRKLGSGGSSPIKQKTMDESSSQVFHWVQTWTLNIYEPQVLWVQRGKRMDDLLNPNRLGAYCVFAMLKPPGIDISCDHGSHINTVPIE